MTSARLSGAVVVNPLSLCVVGWASHHHTIKKNKIVGNDTRTQHPAMMEVDDITISSPPSAHDVSSSNKDVVALRKKSAASRQKERYETLKTQISTVVRKSDVMHPIADQKTRTDLMARIIARCLKIEQFSASKSEHFQAIIARVCWYELLFIPNQARFDHEIKMLFLIPDECWSNSLNTLVINLDTHAEKQILTRPIVAEMIVDRFVGQFIEMMECLASTAEFECFTSDTPSPPNENHVGGEAVVVYGVEITTKDLVKIRNVYAEWKQTTHFSGDRTHLGPIVLQIYNTSRGSNLLSTSDEEDVVADVDLYVLAALFVMICFSNDVSSSLSFNGKLKTIISKCFHRSESLLSTCITRTMKKNGF